jgi:tripartite ATP-independent transporter DctM subunit
MSAEHQLASDAPDPKAARLTFGLIGGAVVVLGAVGGVVVGLVALLALLGTPLFAIMGGVSELAWLSDPDPTQQFLRRLAPEVFGARFAGSPILTTIPLFTFVGYTMAESKTPERLVRAATSWVGWLPGGLAIVCVLASAVFTLFTGGSGVTIIAVGGLLLPALRQRGYSEKFSLGLVTTGGSLGLLLPYALPLLVYAMVTGLDFQLVNKAVLAPGALVLLLFVLYAGYIGVKEKIPRTPFNVKEAFAATWAFKWELGVFALLVVSIKTNMTDIDEAAGLVALYTLGIECFVYKDLSIKKDLVRIAKGSMALAGAVILILAMANALTFWVTEKHIPEKLIEAMLKLGLDKPWQFLIVMNVFLLVLGMVMDGFSAILVAIPLILPFAAHFGLGPFHVAIMFVLNLELAFSCPPLGLNLFIASFRFNRPVVSLYKLAMPFVGLLALALLIITYVPRISNTLVLDDIQEWRNRAEKENRTPREAWKLECVQHDNSNPLPCSDADKVKYPNGRMPDPAVVAAPDAGSTESDEDEMDAIISGKKEAGAPHAPKPSGEMTEEELDALIAVKGKPEAGAAPTPPPAPKRDLTDEEMDDLISGKGKKDGG